MSWSKELTWYADKHGQGNSTTIYRSMVPAAGGSLPARIRKQSAPYGAKGWVLTVGDLLVGRYKLLKDAKAAATETVWDQEGVG